MQAVRRISLLIAVISAVVQNNCLSQERNDKAGGYELIGPYSHGNLAVYLVIASQVRETTGYLTLQEGMQQGGVTVFETGSVGELAVQNKTSKTVYVQAGDVVKGGKQDRVIAVDLLLPPRSGRIPLPTFCVEQGRWSGRGAEETARFGSSQHLVSDRSLKLAAIVDKNQGRVWDNVAEAQRKLARGLDTSVVPDVSASSYALTMENPRLRKSVGECVVRVGPEAGRNANAVGAVFVVNGSVSSADIYGSRDLFLKMWDKLLRAAAAEAAGEWIEGSRTPAPAMPAVYAWMRDAERGVEAVEDGGGKLTRTRRETERAVLLESRIPGEGRFLHRSYIGR